MTSPQFHILDVLVGNTASFAKCRNNLSLQGLTAVNRNRKPNGPARLPVNVMAAVDTVQPRRSTIRAKSRPDTGFTQAIPACVQCRWAPVERPQWTNIPRSL